MTNFVRVDPIHPIDVHERGLEIHEVYHFIILCVI